MSVADIRQKYEKFELLEASVAATPLEQFTLWFDEALKAQVPEPNAMTLATATPSGRPSARIVLLKGFDERGLMFFTNYTSRKGGELADNPHASLLFFWPALERQVRLEGAVEKVSAAESDEYFHSRPLGSRIGAWASPQSQPITHAELEARNAAMTESLGADPARPPHWGGYRLKPDYVEFWQGRPSRLHDRLVFQRGPGDQWSRQRLAP
ncbi:MAG: pyridoxamine 5'-phosphate oxidase [Burkholderiaceae bacterium]